MLKKKSHSFQRVYHPFHLWEEVGAGMWGTVEDRASYYSRAVEFTGNHVLYGEHMRRVIVEWPISCENALTDPHLNKQAWIGHAACALAFGCPEDIVRSAWKELTDEQQFLANAEAKGAIASWSDNYEAHLRLRGAVGGAVLQ